MASLYLRRRVFGRGTVVTARIKLSPLSIVHGEGALAASFGGTDRAMSACRLAGFGALAQGDEESHAAHREHHHRRRFGNHKQHASACEQATGKGGT